MQINSDSTPQYSPSGYPTSYHNLHWDSIKRVKDYLYQQLVPVLEDASSRLSTAERSELARGRESLRPISHRLAMARNTLAAWAALITVESGGSIPQAKRLPVAASALPEWLTEHIRFHTTLTVEYTRPIFVHPEVFFESLLLLAKTGDEIGALLQVTLTDAPESPRGVWLRAIFVPPVRGAYSGMSTLLAALSARQDMGDAAFRLQVTGGLMKLNGSRLVLQNNRKTGEQALAALLPTLTAEDLRGQRSEPKRIPWRSPKALTPATDENTSDLPQPFRLDEDTDRPTEEAVVPAFPPGVLESWLESADGELDGDLDGDLDGIFDSTAGDDPDDTDPARPGVYPIFPPES
jgi:hypothetical protein